MRFAYSWFVYTFAVLLRLITQSARTLEHGVNYAEGEAGSAEALSKARRQAKEQLIVAELGLDAMPQPTAPPIPQHLLIPE